MDELRRCPVIDCTEMIEEHRLMCFEHWVMVEPRLSTKLHRLADRGRGVKTWQYRKAYKECIEAVDRIIAGRPPR